MKRKWIPTIGWILCYGVFHNCVVVPFFNIAMIEWAQLITLIGIMLGVSGARDIGIKRKDKNDHNK